MKNILILALATCAFLQCTAETQSAPANSKRREAQICAMCRDKSTRIMMIQQLMKTKEGKMEMAEMLKNDAEFRSYYETHSVNAG